MKKIILLLFLVLPLAFIGCKKDDDPSKEVVFIQDDALFAYLLENYDANMDLSISKEEANNVDYIKIDNKDVRSLSGINNFPNLEYLSCRDNRITSVDLSKNTALKHLNLFYCDFTSLDLSKNINLEYLDVASNYLTALDLSANTKLKELCIMDNRIATFSLNAPNMVTFLCSGNNINSLDVSSCPLLYDLYCECLPNITNLDLSHNPLLTYLYCTACDNLQTITLATSQTIPYVDKDDFVNFEYL